MAAAAASTCAISTLMQTRLSSQDMSASTHSLSAVNSSITGLSMRRLRGVYVRKSQRPSPILCIAAPQKVDEQAELETEDTTEELSPLVPTSAQIETLLTEVCDKTKIAELEIKVGGFKLHVKRNVGKPKGAAVLAPVAAPPPAPSKPAAPAALAAPSKPSAPPVSHLMSKAIAYEDLQKAAAESGVVFVNSPKVGIFRKARFFKGKFGQPLCREGQTVKEGQIICYLEQLGTQTPVEADAEGDVIKILWEDGVPVGYGDPLIALKPKKAK